MNPALVAFALARVSAEAPTDDEQIYVIQQQTHLVARRWELSPVLLFGVGDRLVNTVALLGRVAFHIDERFAVEATAMLAFPSVSSATRELYVRLDQLPELAKLTEMRWAFGASASWRPVQGKVQLFDGWLGTFSLQVGAGAAVIGTRVPCFRGEKIEPGVDDTAVCPAPEPGALFAYEPTRARFAGMFSAAIDFSFTEYFGVRLEGRDFVFSTRVARLDGDEDEMHVVISDAIRNDILVGLGLNFRI